jgi:hypothetical protein
VLCTGAAHPVHDAGSERVRVYARANEARTAFALAIRAARERAAVQVRYEDVSLVTQASAPAPA